jgi:hypothetical protein
MIAFLSTAHLSKGKIAIIQLLFLQHLTEITNIPVLMFQFVPWFPRCRRWLRLMSVPMSC